MIPDLVRVRVRAKVGVSKKGTRSGTIQKGNHPNLVELILQKSVPIYCQK